MKLLIQLCIFYALLSCGVSENNASTVKIVNGKVTSEYPAVVKMSVNILGNCTGTFVKPDLVLTAGHCVSDLFSLFIDNQIIDVARDVYIHPSYVNSVSDHNPQNDIALVRIPGYHSQNVMKISQQKIAIQENFSIVGFGYNSYESYGSIGPVPTDSNSSGTKRIGYNTYKDEQFVDFDGSVSRPSEKGLIYFSGAFTGSQFDGVNAGVAQGDSGGPMIVNGKGVVGVASGSESRSYQTRGNQTFYVDASLNTQRYFYSEAAKRGFNVFNYEVEVTIPYPPHTEPTPNPKPEPIPTPEPAPIPDGFHMLFHATGSSFYQLEFLKLPHGTVKIDLFPEGWIIPLTTITLPEGQNNFMTDSSYWFGAVNSAIVAIAYDSQNRKLDQTQALHP